MSLDVFQLWLLLPATAILLVLLAVRDHRRIQQLQQQVSCLEHPHGESSTAGFFTGSGAGRRFVVSAPAVRTGCR